MQYTISKNCIVKSQNAALTTQQPNKKIVDYISTLPDNIEALDYGCGKLRHSILLYYKCSQLVVIDSNIQLERIQRISNQEISVIEYIKNYMPNAKAIPLHDINIIYKKYDFILCTNVLSAIPSLDERIVVINNIKKYLKPKGKALISVQYRNSYFNTYKNNENAKRYLDGWLIKRGVNYSFYGLIMPNDLIKLCINHGLKILNKNLHDGSIYLEVGIKKS